MTVVSVLGSWGPRLLWGLCSSCPSGFLVQGHFGAGLGGLGVLGGAFRAVNPAGIKKGDLYGSELLQACSEEINFFWPLNPI